MLGSAVALRTLVTGQYRNDIAVTPTDTVPALAIVGVVALVATVCAAVADRYATGRGRRRS